MRNVIIPISFIKKLQDFSFVEKSLGIVGWEWKRNKELSCDNSLFLLAEDYFSRHFFQSS